jgi:8-oxo-dGTP pyrophosphatase MutT (NUDIX family)
MKNVDPRAEKADQAVPSSSVDDRRAVRAILLTPERQILLLRVRPPDERKLFWITPGGGVDGDETDEVALRRELREELGLQSFTPGPLLWRRQHTFNWAGRRYRQCEHIYLVLIDRFLPEMSDALEMQTLDRFHWWSLAEIGATTEKIVPRSLAGMVERYLREGAPQSLPEIEVLVD